MTQVKIEKLCEGIMPNWKESNIYEKVRAIKSLNPGDCVEVDTVYSGHKDNTGFKIDIELYKISGLDVGEDGSEFRYATPDSKEGDETRKLMILRRKQKC